ncbi:MAG: hypothetical protein PF590_06575 [Candidatus Delongbacteria bacterium]|jgi:Na+/proline symporter|nr:hypothetical protein [Candidatus Delongbacteria bacterium]
MESQAQMLIVMIVYMAILIFWGFYQGRKVKTGSDFAIAGRKLPECWQQSSPLPIRC